MIYACSEQNSIPHSVVKREPALSGGSHFTTLLLHWACTWFHTRFSQPGCMGAGGGTEVRKWPIHHSPGSSLRICPPSWALQMWAGKCSAHFPSSGLSHVQANFPLDALVLTWAWVQGTGGECLSSRCSSWTFSISAAWVLCFLPS